MRTQTLTSDAAVSAAMYWTASVPPDTALSAETGPRSLGVTVVANHGRWVVECPDCSGAQLAVREDKRFMCSECANGAVGGVFRPVIWPKGHEDVERLLDARPSDATRNWRHGDGIDLAEENAANGIGVS